MLRSDKPELVIFGRVDYLADRLKEVNQTFKVHQVPLATSREDFFASLKPGSDLDSLRVIYYSNFTARLLQADKELISHLPPSCIAICNLGAGYDSIDVHAAKERNIQSWYNSDTPNAVNAATATTAMYLILGALRRFTLGERHARQGLWDHQFPLAHDPEGKILGIIGMGGIGRALARRALGFDMKVVYYNRNPVADETLREDGLFGQVEYCSKIEELVKLADVVSLNVPLNESTRGFFNQQYFDMMKKESVLVNTARGGVIDEAALIKAIQENKIYSVGLDVFADEPNIPQELVSNENITLLPHLGTSTRETSAKMENQVLNNCLGALQEGRVVDLVKEHK